MKKVYAIIAVLTLVVCAASCGNNKKAKEPAETKKVENVAKEKSAADQIKDAANEAAVDVAKTGINAAAEAAKDAVKK